jgi:hypothetical protein
MSKGSFRDRSRSALRTVTGRERLDDLNKRVAALEREVQEARRLNRRLAELMDVVQELLLPVAQRDEELLRERLERYSASL